MMRYAIYHMPPPDHPLWRSASRWLGRDADSGALFAAEPAGGFDAARMATLTADPRRYGFHATLKAPFALADGHTESDLVDTFDRFCRDLEPALIDPLVIGRLGPFFALVPGGGTEPVSKLADACVTRFEPFRAALSEADLARRKPDELNAAQRSNLMTWGYPYVFDEFRFHMTLTGAVPVDEQPAMAALLADRFADFHDKPHRVDHVALFCERAPGEAFHVLAVRLLGGKPHRKSA